jgi:hypothetical protein
MRCPWFCRRIVPRQAQKAPRFVKNLGEVGAAGAFADDVEKIAMFARGGVCLMLKCT